MGFFHSFFGKRVSKIYDPEELRRSLFELAQSGNQQRLEQMCRANRNLIADNFSKWQKVPEAIRRDPASLRIYGQALINIGEVFANRFSDSTLRELLRSPSQSDPLLQWRMKFEKAEQLMADLRYIEAGELLSSLLFDVGGRQEWDVRSLLSIVYGHIGACHFQSGHTEQALAPFERALGLCGQYNDVSGVITYLGNLYEANRYLGRNGDAASYAERLAGAFVNAGRDFDASWFRKQSYLVRAGEPLNRVVALVDDLRYELDDVPQAKGIKFVFERNRTTLRPAAELTRKGDALASTGDFEGALELFRAASQSDPFDPHSHYEEGVTLMNLGQYAKAVGCYEATEKLAPGWFHCRSDLWLAQQLARRNIDHSMWLVLRELEDGNKTPAQKLKLAKMALVKSPELAPLHLLMGESLLKLDRRKDAEGSFRKGLISSHEPDFKTRLLVDLALVLESGEEKRRLLHEARELNGNLVAAAMATVTLNQVRHEMR